MGEGGGRPTAHSLPAQDGTASAGGGASECDHQGWGHMGFTGRSWLHKHLVKLLTPSLWCLAIGHVVLLQVGGCAEFIESDGQCADSVRYVLPHSSGEGAEN